MRVEVSLLSAFRPARGRGAVAAIIHTAALAWLATLAACARSSGTADIGPAPSGGDALVLRAAPLELSTIRQIIPLGNLNPPDHTLPTDHIYLNTRLSGPPLPPQPVYAPGDGVVQFILRRGSDTKIAIRRGRATYYLDHVVLDAAVREGAAVTAGQQLGMTGTTAYGIDLGVMDETRTVGFLAPARYSAESLHGDAPLKYFAEPLRSQLYDRVNRVGPDRDGRFNFDVEGRLAGNWFLDGLSAADSTGPIGGSRHLAFVRDHVDPGLVRISIGGTLGLVGVFGVAGGAADPNDVGVASGTVVFRLLLGAFGQSGGTPAGVLIVQMLEPARLRAEIVPGPLVTTGEFSTAAPIYVR